MEHDFNVVHRGGDQDQIPDPFPRPPRNGTEDSDINDDIRVMVVALRLLERVAKVQCGNQEQTHVETIELQLRTLDEFMSGQFTGAYCESIRPTM